MKITSIKSHVLKYELEKELGYSQQYYKHRTTHLVEVQTDDGGTHLAVIAERDEEGNDPYHKPILNRFMGWRMVWFMMPHGYLDGYGDESE